MPTVPTWAPATELSVAEERVLRRCKKQPIFGFLRAIRHELFDDAFQRELATTYDGGRRGRVPVTPALLAAATLLQSARQLSDQDAALAAVNDRAWQVVLGTLEGPECEGDEDDAPFSQTALFDFRLRLIAHDMDRRLVERTLELATRSGLFSPKALRAAFDASPLRGAGRVEDTINLLGHAARDLVHTLARRFDKPFDVMAREAGIPLLEGTSLKAALDVDWSDLGQAHEALQRLLKQIDALSTFIATHLREEREEPPLREQLATLRQVVEQDLEPDPSGTGSRIKRGVAKERRISVRDPQMRHGRKSKAVRFDGYKRHVATLRGERVKLIGAVALTAANHPEGEASYDLFADVERQGLSIATLDVDRAYLLAAPVQWRRGLGLRINGRAPSTGSGGLYNKTRFSLDLERGQMRCPARQERPAQVGSVVKFDARVCNACPQKAQCPKSNKGRSVAVHSGTSPKHRPLVARAAPCTINIRLAILRVIVNAFVEEHDLERNPVRGIHLLDTSEPPTYTDEEPNSLTVQGGEGLPREDAGAVPAALRDDGPRVRDGAAALDAAAPAARGPAGRRALGGEGAAGPAQPDPRRRGDEHDEDPQAAANRAAEGPRRHPALARRHPRRRGADEGERPALPVGGGRLPGALDARQAVRRSAEGAGAAQAGDAAGDAPDLPGPRPRRRGGRPRDPLHLRPRHRGDATPLLDGRGDRAARQPRARRLARRVPGGPAPERRGQGLRGPGGGKGGGKVP